VKRQRRGKRQDRDGPDAEPLPVVKTMRDFDRVLGGILKVPKDAVRPDDAKRKRSASHARSQGIDKPRR
jgi:hypothetical protein